MSIAAVHAAGWFVEDLRERRGPASLWRSGRWYAAIRNESGERIESGTGKTADAALAAALAATTPNDLADLLG